MKHNFSVSVIITTKNEQKNIEKCLKSIKKQSYPGKIEIVLVDNHSIDDTIKIAKKYTSKIIIAGPERSVQRNIGAKAAKGKWLLFLDADMEASPKVISGCIKIVSKDKVPSMVAILQYYRGFNFWGRALALEQNCYGDNINFLTAARFFNRREFLKIGGFNPKLLAGEDWDLTQRFLDKNTRTFHLKKYVIYHNEPTSSLFELFKKEAYYIKFIHRYAKRNPSQFSKQSSISYRMLIWIKSWRKLIRHPILTSAFLWYKFVVWLIWQEYRIARSLNLKILKL